MMKEPSKAWGVVAPTDSRIPATVAVLVAAALNFVLPGKFTLGPPWLFPLVEFAIVIPLSIAAPRRRPHEHSWEQVAAIALIACASVANVASLYLLIRQLIFNGKTITGPELLYSSVAIWLTNVVVFALWYWEVDRGGPDERMAVDHGAPDFLFPQMVTPECAADRWTPKFFDYLYLSFTNATAFSPTDTMPLSTLAKMLMLAESLASLATIAIVASRAINILSCRNAPSRASRPREQRLAVDVRYPVAGPYSTDSERGVEGPSW
ncbi:MAG: hypothetical protein NVSMB21_12780 [Vulcanimicrobiaceae bacterium]